MYKKELTHFQINSVCISIGKIQALAHGINISDFKELKDKWEKEIIEETEKIFNIIISE